MQFSKSVKLFALLALLASPFFGWAQEKNGLVVGAGGYYARIWKDISDGATSQTFGPTSYNFYAWLDYKYLNIQVDFDVLKSKMPWVQMYNAQGGKVNDILETSGFGFAAYGRYPFQLSQMALSPMAGLYYKLYSKKSGTIEGDLADLNALWLKFGGGLDYPISKKMNFKLFILGGYELYSKYDKEMKDRKLWQEAKAWSLDVKIGLGYVF